MRSSAHPPILYFGFPPVLVNHGGTENTEKPQREIVTAQHDDLEMVMRWVKYTLCVSLCPLWLRGSNGLLESIGVKPSEAVVPRTCRLSADPVAAACPCPARVACPCHCI